MDGKYSGRGIAKEEEERASKRSSEGELQQDRESYVWQLVRGGGHLREQLLWRGRVRIQTPCAPRAQQQLLLRDLDW